MSTPQFIHDCDECVFKGRGVCWDHDVDWYVCNMLAPNRRVLIARYSDTGQDYHCSGIGDTLEPARLVTMALAQGIIELTPDEQRKMNGAIDG